MIAYQIYRQNNMGKTRQKCQKHAYPKIRLFYSYFSCEPHEVVTDKAEENVDM